MGDHLYVFIFKNQCYIFVSVIYQHVLVSFFMFYLFLMH